MRSEETQVFGAMEDDAGFFVTPGTHSKWIEVSGGLLTRYTTYTTGEVFAALAMHAILTRHPARVVANIDGLAASSATTRRRPDYTTPGQGD